MSQVTELCHLAADVPDILLKLLLVEAGFDVTYLPQGLNGIVHRQEPCPKERQRVQRITRGENDSLNTAGVILVPSSAFGLLVQRLEPSTMLAL